MFFGRAIIPIKNKYCKGEFAADEVLKIYKKYDIKGGIISLGGSSIYTVGQKPDGTPWNVGIKHPRKDSDQDYVGVIGLSDQALSTSGDYERYLIYDGKRYHHILNPGTGYPTDNGLISVTIVVGSSIPDCNILADILTKTVFISGVDNGLKFIDSLQGVSCIAITSDYNIYKSSNWNIKLDKLDSEFKIAN